MLRSATRFTFLTIRFLLLASASLDTSNKGLTLSWEEWSASGAGQDVRPQRDTGQQAGDGDWGLRGRLGVRR